MGLGFPAGPELEMLALQGNSRGLLGCSMSDGDLTCHFSGAESQVQRWIKEGKVNREDTAREIYDVLARSTARMLAAGAEKTGLDSALVTGGVASSPLFRMMLVQRITARRSSLKIVFGQPEMSGDNAVGVALIGLKEIQNR